MRLWSFSTTVRNPERIRSFLKVIKTLEGCQWDGSTQKKYQILLLQNKLYGYDNPQFYTNLSELHKEWINQGSLKYDQAEEIIDAKNYEGGGDMRGRQSLNPIKKLGLVSIDENKYIKITNSGYKLMADDYDLGDIFFKCLLKWQYPNPDANKYLSEDGYDIKPFIASLHLISKVNEYCRSNGWKVKGVSKYEFALFFLTLSNYLNIDITVNKLVDFRRELELISDINSQEEFLNNYFQEHYSQFGSLKNANTYADNIIRYFRLTRYIYLRGNGWYVDLEPRRSVEIQSLINADNASAISFHTKRDYLNYLGDYYSPSLPWENRTELEQVINLLENEIQRKNNDMQKKGIQTPILEPVDFIAADISYLKSRASYLREFLRELSEQETRVNARLVSNITQYVEDLQNIYQKSKGRSIDLEKFITLGLNALNDALHIKPNYPTGDDNEPTFTAPANRPDIECFYETFNSICEVTLITNRTQWYNEGQPVLRHLRDFENRHTSLDTFCVFVAPSLHRDTINTFWNAVRFGYEGVRQKVVPLTLSQFIDILQFLIILKEKNIFLTHYKIKELYNKIVDITNQINGSNEWVTNIPNTIENWKKSITG